MMSQKRKAAWFLAAAVSAFLLTHVLFLPAALGQPVMQDYTAVPYFMEQPSVKPNILIMLDNSGSMNEYIYRGASYDPGRVYYGYFSSELMYEYDGSKFVINESSGEWSGNFLNFLTMRRIDVLRKVLTGGKALSAQGSGKQSLVLENDTGYTYRHVTTVNSANVSPYDGNYTYGVRDDKTIYVVDASSGDSIWEHPTGYTKEEVLKDRDYAPEADDFYEYAEDSYRLGGVMQKFGNDAQWGNLWFTEGDKKYEGGYISNPIGPVSQFSNLINDLRNMPCNTWTPLSETYYVGMQHFRQKAVEVDGYAPGAAVTNQDPFDHSEWCAKNFVLVLTDGLSTKDIAIPDYLKDYADSRSSSVFLRDESGGGYTNTCGRWDSQDSCDSGWGDGGSDFLKDVAYYARTKDLRDDVYGETNLIPYFVYAFGDDNNAASLLKEAARQGGFEDRNGNNKPDLMEEWDKNGDTVPDTYFEAQDGHALERELERAIVDILNRASSGTSASILSTNEEGEGTMLQAYFKPSVITESGEATWLGYLQSLWIDSCGNLRDDSGANANELDLTGSGADKIIEFVHDEENSETKVRRYTDHPLYHADNPRSTYACNIDVTDGNSTAETIPLNEVQPLFEAGKKLWDTDASSRNIFTSIEGNMVPFETSNDDTLAPYLGVNPESYGSYENLGDAAGERTDNLIRFIRGSHINTADTHMRSRLVTVDGSENTWKLGDIAYSTPVTVGGPVENYHILYSDYSYNQYLLNYKDRENVVYVGANDGMLHAFTHGKRDGNRFTPVEDTAIGSELWAYIPKALLPHLKWLSDPDYSHVYYADLKPKIFDAKIVRDASGDKSWGTFILLGLRMGGKHIWTRYDPDNDGVFEQKDFYPTYTLIDVTDPRDPEIMWERSYEGLGMSFSRPAIVKNGEDWYAVFGSGPRDTNRDRKADLEGWSETDQAHVYVVEVATGDPVPDNGTDYLFSSNNPQSFFNSPVSLDKNLNFNVDAIYLSETYDATTDYKNTATEWRSTLYKINIPADWSDLGYASNYKNPAQWQMETFFTTDKPMNSPVSLSQDEYDNVWVYFGTGRFMGAVDPTDTTYTGPVFDDRSSGEQQYLYGIKDPFYNKIYENAYYHNYASVLAEQTDYDLFDSNSVDVAINDSGTTRVFDAGTSILWDDASTDIGPAGEWDTLVDYVHETKDGWYVSLADVTPSERVISKPGIIGGITLASTYTPLYDPCLFGGYSNLYALYYRTGTAYSRHVFDFTGNTKSYNNDTYTEIAKKTVDIVGAPPPSVGLHAGRQEGASAYVQQSTGEILKIDLDPAMDIRSGLRGWRSK